jgi:hypothetical protein
MKHLDNDYLSLFFFMFIYFAIWLDLVYDTILLTYPTITA